MVGWAPLTKQAHTYAYGESENELLDNLALVLKVPRCTMAASGFQKEQLQRLLNQPQVKREEKVKELMCINQLSAADCEARILWWAHEIESRKPLHQRVVVAEVYAVAVAS